MITNEFFQGYHQALNTVEENVEALLKLRQQGDNDFFYTSALKQVKSHIEQVRKSYKELQKQLSNEQKKKRT
jgi:hypothetical protein